MEFPEHTQRFSLEELKCPSTSEQSQRSALEFLEKINRVSEYGLRKTLLKRPDQEPTLDLQAPQAARTMSVSTSAGLTAWSEALLKIINPRVELIDGPSSDFHVDVRPAFNPVELCSENTRHFAPSPGDYCSIWSPTNLVTALRTEEGVFPAFNPKRVIEVFGNASSIFRPIEPTRSTKEKAFVLDNLLTEADRQAYSNATSGDIDTIVGDYLENLLWHQQYHDFISLSEGGVVLNLGIEKGAEIPGLLKRIGKTGRLINVDPLGSKFIHPLVQEWLVSSPAEIQMVPFAVNHERGELKFLVGKSQARDHRNTAESQDYETASFKCVTLQDIVEDAKLDRLDLIKTDIEGGEGYIVDDIVEVARHFRSAVALSIYHGADQYLELPAILMRGLPDYTFRFRKYGIGSEEGILYAIPNPVA